jgi:hypothetical protein
MQSILTCRLFFPWRQASSGRQAQKTASSQAGEWFSPHGLSVVFTPMLVEVLGNQYTSQGLAKGCQPQIFVGW